MGSLINIEPQSIWKYFDEICKIPRLSKKEDKIIRFLINFAGKNNLEFRKDKTGNLLILKNASAGKENIRPVVLQCHADMVGEKEVNTVHDFDKDPIKTGIKGNWVAASGTTLGADDGIGIASIMALLEDKNAIHGPLECLFTIDEESGMTGAANLEPGFIKSKILLNLDSEDEGQFFIGSAGGVDTIGRFEIITKSPKNKSKTYLVKLSGLKGGHSGDEIHKRHANAIILLSRFLLNASKEFNLAISRFEGGGMRNAIPRDAEALILVPLENVRMFESFFQVFSGMVRKELETTEPDHCFRLSEAVPAVSRLSGKLQQRLLNSLYSCPHGPVEWSKDFEGLVETSTNLASVKFVNNKEIVITTSQRSSVDSAKKDISDRVASIFSLAGARIEQTTGYPGWKPNLDSEILKIAARSYKTLFRKNPVAKTIHAGLECGLILERYQGMDMISFGPTIRGAHTPKERINIKSTLKFWKLLNEVLKNIPGS
jgi:dipeptidase D